MTYFTVCVTIRKKAVSGLILFEDEIIHITKIRTVGMYETEKEFAESKLNRYNVKLSVYELIFFISGENMTHFAGKNIQDMPNSVRYLPKGITDGEYYVEKFTKGVCIDIYFDTDDEMPQTALGLKNMKELKPLFLKIYNVWNSKKSGFYAESMAILYDIIGKIKKHNEKYYTDAQAKKIMPSYDYILENFSDHNFDYKIMSSKSNLSYDYFKELFIKQYGMSPVKYITQLRIEKAKELLITKRYSITEIANMCGFENIYYFSNVFKKHTGVSPKTFSLL